MEQSQTIHLGIGFATGRKTFKNVLRSYIFHLQESRFFETQDIKLHLFVAYDPEYANTTRADYTNIEPWILEKFEACHFISAEDIQTTTTRLVSAGIIQKPEADLCFGNGYASKRNIILFRALEYQMDYLIFLDDDEYPMAVTQSKESTLWSGQHVIEQHLKYLKFADVTNGYHCGYISPIPSLEFDNILTERDFQMFIEALSNDILNWEDMKYLMQEGGITYANKEVLIHQAASLMEETNGAKSISGGNLGLNLTQRDKLFPFYNPPGARGEDTFLGTCFQQVTVKRIPTYTFHDGFSFYASLLQGVLPTRLKRIDSYDSATVMERFYQACLGWIRYKPLYLYITHRDTYQAQIQDIKEKLAFTMPKICAYFNDTRFHTITTELDAYDSQVEQHFQQFEDTKDIWERVKKSVPER